MTLKPIIMIEFRVDLYQSISATIRVLHVHLKQRDQLVSPVLLMYLQFLRNSWMDRNAWLHALKVSIMIISYVKSVPLNVKHVRMQRLAWLVTHLLQVNLDTLIIHGAIHNALINYTETHHSNARNVILIVIHVTSVLLIVLLVLNRLISLFFRKINA